ncbi:P-loop containing nucleoside triphosphate hydrolase protein [Kockovaella imperatae]|uniref:p-loop containing nucleoside triphosphate hydrolase protein n=1 Tax=Kockovaella imperatae TaxID=4999 RepID=A0A1Y1U7J1_9TREE|nr:P-loop containing nucleoside triphosphate hydrolase protein [Kockovaella imperatae]ORX34001.1 P-loop containing nucleoside triphosphate hydrolase protein [Kockovaella imperatae]
MSRLCSNDWSIGPGANCRPLDFTLLFSDVFFAFIPALFLLVLASARFTRLVRKPRRLLPLNQVPFHGSLLLISRVALSIGFLGINVATWVRWELTSPVAGKWSGLLANCFQTLASLALLLIIPLEHFRCNRPSQPPALYLLVNALFIAVRIRTYAILNLDLTTELGVCLALNCALFLALQFSARSSLENGADLPPTATAGLLNRYLIVWVFPVLIRGFKKPLEMDTVGAIDTNLHSLPAWETFRPVWEKNLARSSQGKTKQPMVWTILRAFMMAWLAPVLPYAISSLVSLARPLLLNKTVLFVESYSTPEPQAVGDGWALVGAAALIYLVYSISLALAHIATQRCATALRGALMEALYRKSLVIKVDAAREMGAAKASNLMSVDVTMITQTCVSIHQFWTAILMTGFAMYIIWTQLGLSFLSTVIGSIVFFALLPVLTKDISAGRKAYGAATDARVKFTASVLRHIKAVKMSAYEFQVIKTAVDMRKDEIDKLKYWIREILKVSIMTNWLGGFLNLITIITFTVVSIYTSNANNVNTAKIFTVVSTISIISEPLLMLGQQLSSMVSAYASLKRIETFLMLEERQEPMMEEPEKDLSEKESQCRVEFHNASFGIKDKATILKNLNVHQVDPSLWMIVGKVGCGKSTFLQAILGELDLIGGTSNVQLCAAGYCTQDPWLTVNNSIRQNITFMHPYDAKWYSRVIKAVALDVDLAIIKGGDTVPVSALSGGQKQRVALARAVYGRFQTLILDDVFSALDAETEARVFNELFGPNGLLRGKSVILATNQVYRFSNASHLTVLQEGEIIEQGDYKSLLAKEDGMISQLVKEFAAGKKDQPDEIVGQEIAQLDDLTEPAESQEQDPEKVEKREGARGAVNWSTYLLYLKGMGYVYSGFWVGMVVASTAVYTCINVYLQAWTQSLQDAPRSKYAAFLGGYAGMQVGYLICFSTAIMFCFLYAHPIASFRLHAWQIKGLLSTSLSYFDSRPIGEMVNRFNTDLNLTDLVLPNHAVNFMFIATKIMGSFIIITVAGPIMAAVLVGTAIFMCFIQRFYVRGGRELRRLDLTSKSPIYTLFSETIDADGLRTIRAMKAQEMCLRMMTERCTASQHPAWLLMAIRKWLELALNLCVLVVNTLLVVIAVINRHSVSAGILALAMSEAAGLNLDFMLLIVEWTNVEMSITSIERIQEYIELPPQEKIVMSEDATNPDWLKRGAIRFNNVSARYAPELEPAVRDVSFYVKPGQRVGICGRSGSGKSTLLSVLWRMMDHEAAKGGIFVDGIDIRQIPLQTYRSAMSIIPQDPLILELSLRANLDPEGLHSDAAIWEALDQAQLKSHVETLEGKLDEVMAGDGGSFSRGQRQLLALARAILRRRPILALDEATSSIDARTDAAIQETIRSAFDQATVLTIAHRISTIIDYDKIIVMEQGNIVEMGEPQELLSRPDGAFRRLAVESGAVDAQMGGEGSQGQTQLAIRPERAVHSDDEDEE